MELDRKQIIQGYKWGTEKQIHFQEKCSSSHIATVLNQ